MKYFLAAVVTLVLGAIVFLLIPIKTPLASADIVKTVNEYRHPYLLADIRENKALSVIAQRNADKIHYKLVRDAGSIQYNFSTDQNITKHKYSTVTLFGATTTEGITAALQDPTQDASGKQTLLDGAATSIGAGSAISADGVGFVFIIIEKDNGN